MSNRSKKMLCHVLFFFGPDAPPAVASLIKVGQKKTDSSLRETKTNSGAEGLQQGVCGREKNFACLEFIFCSSDMKTKQICCL